MRAKDKLANVIANELMDYYTIPKHKVVSIIINCLESFAVHNYPYRSKQGAGESYINGGDE